MIFLKKTKAGALQFVLFIGAVIAILLMSFVLLSYTHSFFDKKTDILINTVKSTDFGLKRSLASPMELGANVQISSEKEIGIEIFVKKDFWGVFEKRVVTASKGKTVEVRAALIGGQDQQEIPALYLQDKNRPLILAGNSKITGTAFLPKQGVKMGNIKGESYNGSRLVYGPQKESKSVLPKLSSELENQIKRLTQNGYRSSGNYLDRIPKGELKNSFKEPTIVIRDNVIKISNVVLSGNIIVSASKKIIVESSAFLQDVILLAPEIEIKSGTKGSFQAIATESITVGSKCELQYPTALVVHKTKKTKAIPNTRIKPSIYLDTHSNVRGFLLVWNTSKEKSYFPEIKIEPDAQVTGEVYTTGNMELKGLVDGNVTVGGFVAMENGSIYQNHLYNGQINNRNLDESYVGILLNSRANTKKIMKWLY